MEMALYAHQEAIGRYSWGRFAEEAGVVDTNSLMDCVRSERMAPRIAADIQLADKLGIYATPLLIVGDELYVGLPWDLEAIIARSRAK